MNLRVVWRLALGAAIVVAATACGDSTGERGSGVVITETRAVSGFDGIDLAGEGSVEIEFGDAESLVIEAEDNLMPLLTSDIHEGTLVLGTAENIDPTEDVVYALTVVSLERIRLSGSGNIHAPEVQGDSITIRVTGSGSVVLTDLALNAVYAQISGSGIIDLDGVATLLDTSIPGSGTLDAEGLPVDRANVSISGSGDAVVNASAELIAKVSGSGSIEYLGNPAVDSDISGSGSIEPR